MSAHPLITHPASESTDKQEDLPQSHSLEDPSLLQAIEKEIEIATSCGENLDLPSTVEKTQPEYYWSDTSVEVDALLPCD